MLSQALTWPPLPFATMQSSSVFGFQFATLHVVLSADSPAHSFEFFSRNVPDKYSVDWPFYSLTAPFWMYALPSMKIVPETVNRCLLASQLSWPPPVLQL